MAAPITEALYPRYLIKKSRAHFSLASCIHLTAQGSTSIDFVRQCVCPTPRLRNGLFQPPHQRTAVKRNLPPPAPAS